MQITQRYLDIGLRWPTSLSLRARWMPLALLLLALASIFVFTNSFWDTLYRGGHHRNLSMHGLSLAANLSPQHNFLQFDQIFIDDKDQHHYRVYGRWPVGAFALIKLAILPFPDNYPAQIRSARLLMLAFFVLAMVYAFAALSRLSGSPYLAIAATLWAFSSYWFLYYKDMIFNDIPMLFGMLLVFHGMVVFEQERRWRQLAVKTMLALSLGWQVYGLLAPFLLFAAIYHCYTARSWRPVMPYFWLGFVALLWGVTLLGFNLVAEYFTLRAVRGSFPILEIPSLHRALERFAGGYYISGVKPGIQVDLEKGFLMDIERIGRAIQPLAVERKLPLLSLRELGFIAVAVCLSGMLYLPYKRLWIALILAGFCWSLAMRNFTYYVDFQSIFYFGLPLTLVTVLLYPGAKRTRVMATCASIAVALFIISNRQASFIGTGGIKQYEVFADIATIRAATAEGARIDVSGADAAWTPGVRRYDSRRWVDYYLSKRVFARPDLADFALMTHRYDVPELLTPNNKWLFLYRNRKYTTGRHDQLDFSEIAKLPKQGIRWNAPGNIVVGPNSSLKVRLSGDDISGNIIELSLDNNDDYAVIFKAGDNELWQDRIAASKKNSGLVNYQLALPTDVDFSQVNEIEIKPLSGDGKYSVGHIRFLSE